MLKTAVLRKTVLSFLFFACTVWMWAQEGTYDWRQAKQLFPGIHHAFLDVRKPRILKINVVRIDLQRSDLRFMTSGRSPEWGREMPDRPGLLIRVQRKTVRDYLQEARRNGIDMLVAVNASPWIPWERPWTHRYGCNLGLVISDGVLVDYPNGRPAFIITKDGKFQIRTVKKGEDVSDIQLAVGGFAIILKDGKTAGGKDLQPRTAYGLSADRRYLYLLTLDGRMKGISEGAGTKETGEWLLHFGAWDGINMDGGGSTTLMTVQKDQNGKTAAVRLNYGIYYRTVANSLGIYRVPEDGK